VIGVFSGGKPTGYEDCDGLGGGVGEFVGFAGVDEEGVAGVEGVRGAVNGEKGVAFQGDEEFGHVGVGVGGAGDAGWEDGAGDLGEGGKFAFAEPDLLLGQWIVADGFEGKGLEGAMEHGRGAQEIGEALCADGGGLIAEGGCASRWR
jgi:hypothetical protein